MLPDTANSECYAIERGIAMLWLMQSTNVAKRRFYVLLWLAYTLS